MTLFRETFENPEKPQETLEEYIKSLPFVGPFKPHAIQIPFSQKVYAFLEDKAH